MTTFSAIQPFTFGDEPSNIGELAGVSCIVPKGDIPLEIHWSLNGEPIMPGTKGISITRLNFRTSALSIDSLEGHHRGVYKCLTQNKAGTVEYSAELFVNGTIYMMICFIIFYPNTITIPFNFLLLLLKC